jgi:hypothetical protein
MINLKKFIGSRTGIIVLSIILGFGLSCMFKITCDSGSCLVFKGPDFNEKKIIKYNDKCYEANEHMETCDEKRKIINV